MKRTALFTAVLLILCVHFAYAAGKDNIIVIKDKMFLQQVTYIYLNPKDYIGKTIKYEGIFKSYYWKEARIKKNYVLRYGPGCCANDGEVGFEIIWNGKMPVENDWCEVVGTFELHTQEDGWQQPSIKVQSIKVLPTRGQENVR